MKAKSGFRFHSTHQFLVKWRLRALTGSEPLILRPGIDSGSGFQPLLGDVHADACGLKSKGLRALRCIPRVLDSLEVGVRHCSWAAGEAGLRRAKRAGKTWQWAGRKLVFSLPIAAFSRRALRASGRLCRPPRSDIGRHPKMGPGSDGPWFGAWGRRAPNVSLRSSPCPAPLPAIHPTALSSSQAYCSSSFHAISENRLRFPSNSCMIVSEQYQLFFLF